LSDARGCATIRIVQCPFCDHPDSKVTDSRPSGAGRIRRRRECERCGQRFTTHEQVDLAVPPVVKRDGHQEPFDRDKLLHALRRVAKGRPVMAGSAPKLVDLSREIEMQLSKLKEPVASARIAELVHEKLGRIDRLCADRFGTKYKREDGALEFAPERTTRTRSPQLALFGAPSGEPEPDEAAEGAATPRRRARH
jgi:transcriptional repressor NrdR